MAQTTRLSPNEIRSRAAAFAIDFRHASNESQDAQNFWRGFFAVFGLDPRRVGSYFEAAAKRLGGKGTGRIDLFWPGVLLVEHKSRGQSLDRAYEQASEYLPGLKDHELPQYIVVSDFAQLRLYDLLEGTSTEFPVEDLPKRTDLFGFMIGAKRVSIEAEVPANRKAAQLIAELHDLLRATGYIGHNLEVFLVRLLFCLFAEDTGVFPRKRMFQDFIEQRTQEDGSDLAARLQELFHVLNTDDHRRLRNLDSQLDEFPYVNGSLFAEPLDFPAFDSPMRRVLLRCCSFDWSLISPAIFGSMFQAVMEEEDEDARRQFGAHYTSEQNILKTIRPLFLDELRADLERIVAWRQDATRKVSELQNFHTRLADLRFLDPACGCGNFLIIAYREIRKLEIDVLKAIQAVREKEGVQLTLDVRAIMRVRLDHFHGIELHEFPVRITEVSMWIMAHMMNEMARSHFGENYPTIPLVDTAQVRCANALTMDWQDASPPRDSTQASLKSSQFDYIFGNPPFIGAKSDQMTSAMRSNLEISFAEIPDADKVGVLDYVAAWYAAATVYIKSHTAKRTKAAFVSTNSITQGEQVEALWGPLFGVGIRILFAHTTFRWSNDAPGVAAVHCVILGITDSDDTTPRLLFSYSSPTAAPQQRTVASIGPYLLPDTQTIVRGRSRPLAATTPKIVNGSIPADGGNLLLDDQASVLHLETAVPDAAPFIRRYVGAVGFISGNYRYCLWLKNAPAPVLRSPAIRGRLEAVQSFRRASSKPQTQQKAETPSLFTEDRQPAVDYLAIPRTSSEHRRYIPIGYLPKEVIAANDLQLIPAASLAILAVVTSAMHMAWTRMTSGRLKSDIRYSVRYTYNTFPWPPIPDSATANLEVLGAALLAVRGDGCLADLYDEVAMPPGLVRAHQAIDLAVDRLYRTQPFKGDEERLRHLITLYEASQPPARQRVRRART